MEVNGPELVTAILRLTLTSHEEVVWVYQHLLNPQSPFSIEIVGFWVLDIP